ncbi:MAG: FAD-dependent oxidoreductase [Chloroflexi bacterium]|nr:FAD-dependent oxidoreductase [Chloroflexota bacterium]
MDHRNINRRTFLKLSTAIAATTALPFVPGCTPARQEADRTVDVAIIGAGLAGLTAARQLVAQGIESVLVIEAQDYVGGRLRDVQVNDTTIIEAGGQFIGPPQTRILELAAELGVETYRIFEEGDAVYHLDGDTTRFPPYDFAVFGEYDRIRLMLDGMAQTVPLGAPWNAPDAEMLDNMSFGDFLDANLSDPIARDLFDIISFSILNAFPPDLSLLYVLFFIHSCVDINTLVATEGGAQDSRFLGGAQLVPIRMAAELGEERVLLQSPVRSIHHDDTSIQIVSDRAVVDAQYAIVAMMPSIIRNITFEPSLPDQRQGLIENWPISGDFKVNVVYETPFWREQGFSGFIGQSDRVAASFGYDNSPPDADVGIFVTWPNIGADPSLADPDNRREAVLNSIAAYFGDQALDPIDYLEHDWTDNEWIPACVSPVGEGLLTQYGPALLQPVGRIHWAGTETSPIWNGYMEGAVRSGDRVAEEVAALILANR